MIVVAPEVAEALEAGRPVVALETTLVAHGFPRGRGAEVARESESRVRAAGAIPATVGVVDGAIRVGLTHDELDRFSAAGADARKAGPRDLAACVVQRALGATTVGGTLAVARAVGLRFLGTGGIGGVHRGWRELPDVSPDLRELASTRAVVVASGAKSLLDVPATAELLETLAVPVLGYRTATMPRFYTGDGGPAASARIATAAEAADIATMHWRLGGHGVLVANPPAVDAGDVDPLIEAALDEASRLAVSGQDVTPFVLAFLHDRSGGATLEVNARLVADNASLAAEIAVAYAPA